MHGIEKRWPQAALVLLLGLGRVWADDPPPSEAQPAAPQGVDLTVDAAPEPTPALKYHLLPPAQQQVPGNAAPIYLRLNHERRDEWRERLNKEADRLLGLTGDAFPTADAQAYLDSFDRVLTELHAAARRDDCNWEYVTEGYDPLLIVLSDAAHIRSYGRLLAVQARSAAQQRQFDEALGALQAGLALSRNEAQAPFMINQLVAIAIAGKLFEQADHLVQQPGAPNLYWALAELPRPLVAIDRSFAFEGQLLEKKFPELANVDQPRPASEWERLNRELRAWSTVVAESNSDFAGKEANSPPPARPATSEQLRAARSYLAQQLGADRVEKMLDPEVEVRYTVGLFRETTNAWQKWFYLPYPLARGRAGSSQDLQAEVAKRELYPLVSFLIPATFKLEDAQARIERIVARLMAVEALRMHAAVTGSLPATLAEVQVVPVPNDPGTGRAFDYRLEGGAAVLDIADLSASDREALRLPVRLKLRAK